jgi:DNA-binding XRE family transcriptional regulator
MGRKISNGDFNEKIANKLQQYRKQCKLERPEVGRKLGIHYNSVLNHESGNYPHNLYVLLLYCGLYGINLTEFLEGIEV